MVTYWLKSRSSPSFSNPRVQVADVRDGLDDRLAVEREDEAQRGVRGRVLRAEVQGVEVLLVGRRRRRSASASFKRHRSASVSAAERQRLRLSSSVADSTLMPFN